MDAHEHTKMRGLHAHSKWQAIVTWVRTHKRITAAMAIVLTCLLSAGAYALFAPSPDSPIKVPLTHEVKKKKVEQYYSPLTGLPVANEAATKSNVTAIMIENSPDARPQSGLQQADVVYEAIAEGGITRFAALYQQQRPELIGPVRSLRMYYIDWTTPYDPAVAHVGGSLFALQEIRNGSHKDLDQFSNPGAFWRTSDRYAPHNVYTSFASLDELNASRGYAQSNPQPIARRTTVPGGAVANQVNVTMSGPTYNSAWQYDAGSKTYLRSQAGAPHTDQEAGHISSQVVVVLKAQMNSVMEDGVRENYQTTGTGDAVIFAEGKAHGVIWHKENMRKQMFFTDKDGKSFPLPRGKTWISVVPVNNGGDVSWQ
ncbi:MAG: hypothetical protein UY35_C0017G0019 [Candidatus Saccharibacteria bacterium GW2011_GWC2_48_9]|nr:MAG: hypothetical protein UY35_C0017G0019 [Candidatus Saccharibacteria bacterium GW2011_GWC2_48_9]HCH34960.1 DUF3048 domain-containing protein [Candidatus Saccharibacteria bacterium]